MTKNRFQMNFSKNETCWDHKRKDQDIINAILLLRISKERFQKLRRDG